MKKGQRLRELEAQVRRLEIDLSDTRERIAILEKQTSIPLVPIPAAPPTISPWMPPHGPVWTGDDSVPLSQPITIR